MFWQRLTFIAKFQNLPRQISQFWGHSENRPEKNEKNQIASHKCNICGYNVWLSLEKWGQSVKVQNLPYPFLHGQPLKALCLAWIGRLLSTTDDKWKAIPNYYFRKHGSLLFLLKCNYDNYKTLENRSSIENFFSTFKIRRTQLTSFQIHSFFGITNQ